MRQALVYRKDVLAGVLTENEGEYTFVYDSGYLQIDDAKAISLTMPLQKEAFVSPVLFPFFDGLIPEDGFLMWHFATPTLVFLTACRFCCCVAKIV